MLFMKPTEQLKLMGLELPKISSPAGNYVHGIVLGNLLYLAGKGHGEHRGKVGNNVSLEQAAEYAKTTTLMLLSAVEHELGSIDRVKRVVKINGYINSTPDFKQHPDVMNGCSDLMVQVFGEAGKHARTSVGVASLPHDIPVEIEAIVEFN